jgi:hypothetical protein
MGRVLETVVNGRTCRVRISEEKYPRAGDRVKVRKSRKDVPGEIIEENEAEYLGVPGEFDWDDPYVEVDGVRVAAAFLREPCGPVVKVKAGSKVFRGTVAEVGVKVKKLIEFWQVAQYSVDPEALYGGTTLPEEAISLTGQEPSVQSCPECGGVIKMGQIFEPGTPFLRGMVQRSRRPWYAPWRTRPYCAVICPHCKDIVGWEEPAGRFEPVRRGPYR